MTMRMALPKLTALHPQTSPALPTPVSVRPIRASPAARQRAAELGIVIEDLAARCGDRVTVAHVEAEAVRGSPPVLAGCAVALRREGLGMPGMLRMPDMLGMLEAPGTERARVNSLSQTADVTRLEAARQRLDVGDSAPTLLAFVVKACVIGLREHPRMNASVLRGGRGLAIKRHVHVALTQRTASTAAEVSCTPESPPTFWVTPLAGSRSPSLHPTHVGALGVGRVHRQSGRVVLGVSFAYDCRANHDGAARAFLATIVELLEDPITMLIRA